MYIRTYAGIVDLDALNINCFNVGIFRALHEWHALHMHDHEERYMNTCRGCMHSICMITRNGLGGYLKFHMHIEY